MDKYKTANVKKWGELLIGLFQFGHSSVQVFSPAVGHVVGLPDDV